MSAFNNISSHLRDLGHNYAPGSSSSQLRAVPTSLQGASWAGQLAQSATAQSLLGEALLNNLVLPGEISALAVDPVQGFLAVGTSAGTVHLFGSPSVQLSWPLRPSQPVKFLLFKPGTPLLVCADSKENLSIYDLSRPDPSAQAKSQSQSQSAALAAHTRRTSISQGGNYLQPHPDTPTRIAAHVARNTITTLHLSPSHSHLFVGLRDGTVDTYDLERLHGSPYRIPNCWYEEEELLRKSGVPDAPPRRHVPLVTDMAISPKDLNVMLMAYEGGAVLLDIKQRSVIASFQLRLLPGAPGAGGIAPAAIWTERGSPATCVAWRPDGQAFAIGHEDGLISFWNPIDDSKPVLVRSLVELDLDRPTVDDLPNRPPREPVFKMAWAGFPGKGWLDTISGEKKTDQEPGEETEAGTTILSVLGGAVAGQDPPGVALLNFPQYVAPVSVTSGSFWSGPSQEPSPDVLHKTRQSLRSSLSTTRESRLLSNGDVQDFVLLPRSSPHYGMAWDPVAIIMLVDKPSGLPPLAPPSASRGLMAARFPPLPPPGQHPHHHHQPSSSSSSTSHIPSTGPTTANPGPTPTPPADFIAPRPLALPFSLASSGSGAIMHAELINLSPHNYRRLIGAGQDMGEDGDKKRHQQSLPLKGGLAAAGVVGNQTPESLARAPGNFRILMTQHLDGSIRFADASQHLLLVPTSGFQSKKPASGEEGSRASTDSTATPQFLDRDFPQPLPHLTISIRDALVDPSLGAHPKVNRLASNPHQIRISSVHFAKEVMEVSVVLRGGLLMHYRFDQARFSQSSELEQELQEEIQRDREDAEHAAFNVVGANHGDPTSPQHDLQGKEEIGVGAALQNDMQNALQDLDLGSNSRTADSMVSSGSVGSIGGPAPPRPKRDPKRGTIRNRLLGNNKEPTSPAAESSRTSPPQSPAAPQSPRPAIPADPGIYNSEEFTSLDSLNDWSTDGFKAHLLIDLNRGDVNHLAHSDIGFLAISCGAGFAIVDLRGPEILTRDGMGDDFTVSAPGNESVKSKGRRSQRKLLEAESKAAVTSLTWTICRLPGAGGTNHSVLAPRAIITRSNGLVTVWTMLHVFGMWIPERSGAVKAEEFNRPEEPGSHRDTLGLQVLDVAGNKVEAVPGELQRCIREMGKYAGQSSQEDILESDTSLLFGWNGSTLFIRSGLLGVRYSKVDTTEAILSAGIIERQQEKVIVAVSESSVRVYDAPNLELIQRIQRHGKSDSTPGGSAPTKISIDNYSSSGIFLETVSSLDVRLWTLFSSNPRASQPNLLLYTWKPMAAHPGSNAVTSITSWFSTKAATTSSIDDVLAGPNRPAQGPSLPDVKTKEDFINQIIGLNQPLNPTTTARPTSSTRPATNAKGPHQTTAIVNETSQTQGAMNWNIDLAKRRGEAMASLENSLSSLEKNANNWVKESKAAIVKSAAKDKLAKFGL
ncbi:unnamed protein product [Sympodiomycopsis kandeliae]